MGTNWKFMLPFKAIAFSKSATTAGILALSA